MQSGHPGALPVPRESGVMSITVLSPHRDDAVFSLGGWMRLWTQAGIPVRVLNFFTRSGYAPWLADGGDVSERRAYEDRQALRAVSPHVMARGFDLFDAPLRLKWPVRAVMGQSAEILDERDVEHVRGLLRRIARSSVVIAPLGLGGHIDHLTVRQAALASIPGWKLAFYEDLPYATWTGRERVEESVGEVSRERLRRITLRSRSRLRKQSWAAKYRSQIQRADAALIASWRESIWCPRPQVMTVSVGNI